MISIIVPVLNEEDYIGKLLDHLLITSNPKNISEIIVVDGGSKDKTKDIVQDFSNSTRHSNTPLNTPIKLVHSKKGRAKQMNLGETFATGIVLYFLHADTLPPKKFDEAILNEIKKGHNAGCFRMQFDSNHWWLRLASWFTQFKWRSCRGGDQSQFITKTLFNAIDGFDEDYIIYEDNILINKLYARNEFVVINKKLKSSARMYTKHGIWKLQYIYWSIYVKKWFGADSNSLYAYYKKHLF